ncbi:MAG: phosphotransferase family protein [Anaerolineae bacterium]
MPSKKNNLDLIALLTNMAIPTNSARPIEVSHVTKFPSWQHDTIIYNSIWDGGQVLPLGLRSYRNPLTYWQTQDPHKPERVWAVLRRLRLDSFPSPRPLARGEFGKTRYIIWHLAPGRPWYNPRLSVAPQTQSLIPQLAELLARLHALNHDGLNNEPLYQATVAGTLVRMLLWSREMGNEDLRLVIGRLKPAVAGLKSWPHRLIHGDPHLGNVLVHEGSIAALLNWENAAIGDPRWDVMTAAHWLRRHSPEQADQLVNWYETFTGRTITARPFWFALISVRLWALKSWLRHAVEHKIVSSECKDWTRDVAEAKHNAFADLAEAGL